MEKWLRENPNPPAQSTPTIQLLKSTETTGSAYVTTTNSSATEKINTLRMLKLTKKEYAYDSDYESVDVVDGTEIELLGMHG